MNSKSYGALDIVLVVAAVAMVGWYVARDFVLPAQGGAPPLRERQFISRWEEARSVGRETANGSATMRVVEFVDLECAACAIYHQQELPKFRQSLDSTEYSWIVVHFPLKRHRFAIDAARAAECAADADAFARFIDVAFERQEHFGTITWTEMAYQAGIADTAAFSACVARDDKLPRVAAGRAIGDSLAVTSTPSLIVNGWLLPAPPPATELIRIQGELRAGRRPFP